MKAIPQSFTLYKAIAGIAPDGSYRETRLYMDFGITNDLCSLYYWLPEVLWRTHPNWSYSVPSSDGIVRVIEFQRTLHLDLAEGRQVWNAMLQEGWLRFAP